MKKVIGTMFMFLFFFGLTFSKGAFADGCYLCEGGGYVKYKGSDTFEKRKKAKEIGCKVTGTTGSCSNPKGTVEWKK